jgi:putative Mg2+ transporter-C (MgtC) family protein
VNPELSWATQLDLVLRLSAGVVLGAVIGFERELRGQPAGFRTHSLVSLGAALFTVVSAFAFIGPGIDPTRIAAQIVSGIGFIGAGTILQYRGHIRGLTTAASLWSVAAIGTAAGAGLYVVAVAGTILILVVLSILEWVENIAVRRLNIQQQRLPTPDDKPDGKSEDMP